MRSCVLFLLVAAGCGDDGKCLLDTDCELGFVCLVDRCQSRGGGMMDAGPRPDAMPPGDAMTDTAPADVEVPTDTGPPVRRTGTINIRSQTVSSVALYFASASFSESMDSPSPCMTTTADSCTVLRCPRATGVDAGMPGDAGTDGGTDAGATAPNAGVITITADTNTAMLTPSADGTYPPAMGLSALWAGPATMVNARAVGASVPAFEGVVRGTEQVTVSTTPDSSGGVFSFSRTAGVMVTWTRPEVVPSNANVVMLLTVVDDGIGNSVTVTCRYPVASMMGQIPPMAFSAIPADSPASLTASVEDSTPVMSGGWEIRLVTSSPGLNADGSAYLPSGTIVAGG